MWNNSTCVCILHMRGARGFRPYNGDKQYNDPWRHAHVPAAARLDRASRDWCHEEEEEEEGEAD